MASKDTPHSDEQIIRILKEVESGRLSLKWFDKEWISSKFHILSSYGTNLCESEWVNFTSTFLTKHLAKYG